MDWAKSIGGELPDRVESTLLFATMEHEFRDGYYWTCDQHSDYADVAWLQGFAFGAQQDSNKGNKWRARAVRRVIIR